MLDLTVKILKWEIIRNLTNKQFLIGLIVTPVIILIFAGLPGFIERIDTRPEATFYVEDKIGIIGQLQQTSENITFIEKSGEDIEVAVREDDVSGYIIIDYSWIETGVLVAHTNDFSERLSREMKNIFSGALREVRLQLSDSNEEQLAFLMAEGIVQIVAMDEVYEPREERFTVAVGFIIIVYYLIFVSGMMLLESSLQEKRDRMAEVILSSVSADNLMQGKILGHFILGIIQIVTWLAVGLPIAWYMHDFQLFQAIQIGDLPIPIFFGLMGYLFYASLYVGLGATMEDIQSASNTQGMLMILPVFSFFLIGPAIGNPHGIVSKFGFYFPLTSPAIVSLRTSVTNISGWEIFVSGILLVISTLIMIKTAAKIFRVGMLMYGKPATWDEIWKWLKHN